MSLRDEYSLSAAEQLARFVAGRAIKIIGNALKVACYPAYWLMPQVRFTIPRSSKALLQPSSTADIPQIVWQTNFTRRVTLPVYINHWFNRVLAPTYEFRLYEDNEINEFVREECPDEYPAFSKLQIGAARADFWRLLILQKRGGVYLDMDAHFVWPLQLIVSARAQELYIQHRDGRLSNYFLASKKCNQHLALAISAVLAGIDAPNINNVFEITGPAVLDRSLKHTKAARVSYRMVCCQGTFTNEFFQYADFPEGKWTKAQEVKVVVQRD